MRFSRYFVLAFFMMSTVAAQDRGGRWYFRFNGGLAFLDGTYGQVGSALFYKQRRTPPQLHQRTDYSFTKKPVKLPVRGRESYSAELGLQLSGGSTLRFKAQDWWFRRAAEGSIETPGPNGREWYRSAIEIWDANVFALPNDNYPGKFSPISYSGEEEFSVGSVDIFLDFKKTPVFAGVRFAKPKSALELGVKGDAFLSGKRGYGYEFFNHVTLGSRYESKFSLLFGPLIGIEKELKWRRLSFAASLNETVLFGSANYIGVFTDVDDMTFTDWADDRPGASEQYFVLDGRLDFQTKERVLVPVTSAEMTLGFRQGNVTAGLGAFAQIWHGLPLGPTLHRPWDIGNNVTNAPSGLEWKIEGKVVKLYGVFFFVTLSS